MFGAKNTGDEGKVGIRGGISGFGTTDMRIYSGNVNGQLYCEILQKELKHSLAKIPEKVKMIFEPDRAPWHASNILKGKNSQVEIERT